MRKIAGRIDRLVGRLCDSSLTEPGRRRTRQTAESIEGAL